ncbi:MAG: hypothetical protein SGPRY_002251, partial [Prymnesium sp.]
MRVEVEGNNLPLKMPVNHFDELSRELPPTVLENLHHVNGPPTKLQQYALPVHLEGRDLIVLGASMQDQVSCVMASSIAGVLKTRHSAREPGCCRPRALVLVPTREHAQVAEVLATGLARGTGLQCALAYGGHSIERSLEELVKDPGLLIATPTRLLDLTERGVVQLSAVKFLAIVAVDTLLEYGFLPQLQQLMEDESVPPASQRQTALTGVSMTSALKVPLRRRDERGKPQVTSLNGDRSKNKDREAVIHAFVSGEKPILIATDAYIQRLEYTGRAGHTGIMTTLVTDSASVADSAQLHTSASNILCSQ